MNNLFSHYLQQQHDSAESERKKNANAKANLRPSVSQVPYPGHVENELISISHNEKETQYYLQAATAENLAIERSRSTYASMWY